MNIYEAFEVSDEATAEGVWLDIVFQGQTACQIRIRSASPDLNPELRKAMTDRAVGLLKNAGKAKSETDAAVDSLSNPDTERALFAQAVVTDWKGVTDRDGKAIKCTPKNVEQVFRDLPLLFKQVKSQAYRWETFRRVVTEAALGNCATSSASAPAD